MRRAAVIVFVCLATTSVSRGQNTAPPRQPAPTQPRQPIGPPQQSPATGQRPTAGPPVAPPPRTAAMAPANPTMTRVAPPAMAPQPTAPFTLTPAEEAEVTQALAAWEGACAKISDAKCSFHRIDENRTFDKREDFDGEIKYKKPDKARYSAKGGETQEQYFCDGLSLYEWNYSQKQIVQHILPEDMRGAAIADGPLPFLFTATAEKLRNRYFLRIVTPAEQREKAVWMEAYPRHQRDAGNFYKATVILDRKLMLPSAIEIFEPGTDPRNMNRKVHTFSNFQLNDPLVWLKGDFNKPWAMPGWKFLVDDPEAEAAAQAAQLPAAGPRR